MATFSPGDRKPGFPPSGDPIAHRPEQALRRSDIETLMEDLTTAAQVQQSLFPQTMPRIPGYDFACFNRPARTLSGDFYDLLPTGDGRWGVVIADASGKSIPAAMMAMICHVLFRTRPEPAATPTRVLGAVNRNLSGNIKRGTFVSGIYAVLDPAAHKLQVANAGHLPLVVWHSKPKLATTHRSHGAVLGVLAPNAYESDVVEETIPLDVGDRFLMLTDGVNEAMAPGQKEFGMEHLRQRLKADSDRPSAEFLKGIIQQIDLHRGGGEQSDDITLVTARRLA